MHGRRAFSWTAGVSTAEALWAGLQLGVRPGVGAEQGPPSESLAGVWGCSGAREPDWCTEVSGGVCGREGMACALTQAQHSPRPLGPVHTQAHRGPRPQTSRSTE